MQKVQFIYWQEGGDWVGYPREYPDYWSQGETLEDLKEHLRDLHSDFTSGEIPAVRKIEELDVP